MTTPDEANYIPSLMYEPRAPARLQKPKLWPSWHGPGNFTPPHCIFVQYYPKQTEAGEGKLNANSIGLSPVNQVRLISGACSSKCVVSTPCQNIM